MLKLKTAPLVLPHNLWILVSFFCNEMISIPGTARCLPIPLPQPYFAYPTLSPPHYYASSPYQLDLSLT